MHLTANGKALPACERKQSHRSKILLIMRLTSIMLLAFCLQLSARTTAQQITLSVKDESLQNVFKELTKQSGYQFFYNESKMAGSQPVTLQVKDMTLENVLDLCFRNQPFTYAIVEKNVVVKDKPENPKETEAFPPGDIHGRITNAQGVPLAGANVIVKRTKRGVQTNIKGEFTLKNVYPDDVLQVSFIGYKTVTIKVDSGKEFPVVMELTSDELDKVVVQAYGTTTQRLATGNIATVTAAEIERQPVMNVFSAIQGKVPGLVITQNGGYASAPFKVEIRGRSAINDKFPSEPLYIIDGVPLTILETGQAGGYSSGSVGVTQNGLVGPAGGQSPFFSINPDDVESVSVLKDADATAIYGSRGANGVIIITTKKGKPGKTKVDVKIYHGASKVTQHYSMMNTAQYLQMRHEAFKNDNVAMNISNAYDLLGWDTTRSIDWQKELWGGTGQTTDAQMGLSGGDKQTTFRVGGGYHHETNIMSISGADQRASVQFNITHKSLNQRLSLSFTSMYSYTRSDLVFLPSAASFAPNAPPFIVTPGQLNWEGWKLQPSWLQGYGGALFQGYNAKSGLLNSGVTLQYNMLTGLNFIIDLGYSTSHNSQTQIQPIAGQNPAYSPKGTSSFGNNNNSNAIVQPQLEYNRAVWKGKLNILLGGSLQSASQDGNVLSGQGYINDNLLYSIANAPVKSASDVFARYNYAAGFARINYNWEDKYIINLSARRDGSSKFGPGKQYGNFGAVGAAWIFTEENWFRKHLAFLSFGKLRGSYGITGSDNIGIYGYLTQWSAAFTYPYNGIPAYVPLLLNNPELQWQSNRKLEGALNLGFFKDRITTEIAFYRNRCSNQLVDVYLPMTTGFPIITANFPATVQNAGLETRVTGKLIDKRNFSWSVNFNIGINRNKLVAFPELETSPYANSLAVGKSLGIRRLLHYTGVDPATGQYTFEDRNHNGAVDYSYQAGQSSDLYEKDLTMKFEGGIGTDINYKGWQLNLFFRFRKQELPSAISNTPGKVNANQSTQFLDHWQKPGDHARYARYTTLPKVSDSYFYSFSDGIYSDGSYIRLQNLSISYDFPTSWINKIGIRAWQIYARGQNLFLLTRYNGVDPDAPSFGALPPPKIFSAGMQFTF